MVHNFQKVANFVSFASRVARLVRVRPNDSKEIVSLARTLYGVYLKDRPFVDAVRAFLDLCYTIDQVKIQTTGRDASTVVSNALHTALAYTLAMKTAPTEQDLGWLDELLRQMEESTESNDNWGCPKLRIFRNGVQAVRQTRQFAAGVSSMPRDPLFAGLIEEARVRVDEMRGEIREMMERLLELRRYGIKPAYFNIGSILSPGNSWVIWDYRDFRDVAEGWTWGRGNMIAQVALAQQRELQDLRIATREQRFGRYAAMRQIEIPFPAFFTWSMDREAEFDLSIGLGAGPVREIFEEQGKGLEYEVLKFHQWFRLYDLIVPLETVLKMPAAPITPGGTVGRIIERMVRRKVPSPIADLVLPRVRSLDDPAALISQLEQEIEEGERETKRRTLRQHEVEAHIRKLPPRRHPSPAARQLALNEFGIELASNETFVKRHERGSGSPAITSHRVRA